MPVGFSHITQVFGDKPKYKSGRLIRPNWFPSLSIDLGNVHLTFHSGPALEDEQQSTRSCELYTGGSPCRVSSTMLL